MQKLLNTLIRFINSEHVALFLFADLTKKETYALEVHHFDALRLITSSFITTEFQNQLLRASV